MGITSLDAKLIQKLTAMNDGVYYEVFIYLRKAYGTLGKDQCMEILIGYGVKLRTERILKHYWDHLSIVARAGHYWGTPFKVHQGVTQGGPLSPTIFKMVVEVVICHWVMLLAGGEAGPDGFWQVVQWLVALFYADDVHLASPRPSRI